MKNYIFKTTATMKEYNCKKWWIDSDIVGEIRIAAENVREALEKYRAIVKEKHKRRQMVFVAPVRYYGIYRFYFMGANQSWSF